MSYLTMRDYVRSGPICLGALLVIAGAIVALLPSLNYEVPFLTPNEVLYGGIIAVVGLVFIVLGFFMTKKKRDSVLAPVDTRVDDTPPPPPPPD